MHVGGADKLHAFLDIDTCEG